MKANHVIAAILAILGLLVMTYAQTRYWTTQLLAANAKKTMIRMIQNDGLYAERYPERLPNHVIYAMESIGGRYNWHNEGVNYTVYGAMIILLGYVVARTGNTSKKKGQQIMDANLPIATQPPDSATH